jgi:predicted RNase H-like HicB family nuclease
VPIVTEGNTPDGLQTNMREAVALYLEGDNASYLCFSTSPAIL